MMFPVKLNKVGVTRVYSLIEYFRDLTHERVGYWADDGVNLVGIRDDSLPAKKGKQKIMMFLCYLLIMKLRVILLGLLTRE